MSTVRSPSLAVGNTNRNEQKIVEQTDKPGTDHGQYVYRLQCQVAAGCAGSEPPYGANGSDFHLRKCPLCQGGRPGI